MKVTKNQKVVNELLTESFYLWVGVGGYNNIPYDKKTGNKLPVAYDIGYADGRNPCHVHGHMEGFELPEVIIIPENRDKSQATHGIEYNSVKDTIVYISL